MCWFCLLQNRTHCKPQPISHSKLDTNPVVVRRVLASLQQAKLIESQKGPTGGSRLLKSPKAISLADVYKAVETGSLFHTPSVRAAAALRVNGALEKIFSGSMIALLDEFEKTSLSQVLKRVGKTDNQKIELVSVLVLSG